MFEEDFGTISFTSIIRLDFSNPINEEYLSGQLYFAVRSSLTPYVKQNYDISFTMSADQLKVKSLKPFFLSETRLEDFQKTFKKALGKQTEKVISNKLHSGFSIPIGLQTDIHQAESEVLIHKDMLVIKKAKINYTPILKFSRFDAAIARFQNEKWPDLYDLSSTCFNN